MILKNLSHIVLYTHTHQKYRYSIRRISKEKLSRTSEAAQRVNEIYISKVFYKLGTKYHSYIIYFMEHNLKTFINKYNT